jgi:hypothetical protein
MANQPRRRKVSRDASPDQAKRHLTGEVKAQRQAADKARDFRPGFLRNLKPSHALYQSEEARAAHGAVSQYPMSR